MIKRLLVFMIIIALSVQFVFADETANMQFTDLDETYWAYNSIQKMYEAKIISGYPDNTFKPDSYITRAELVKLTNLVFLYTQKQEASELTDIKIDDWFYDHVLIAQKAGYIVGYEDGSFRPSNYITRQELCKILDVINNFVELPNDQYPVDEVSLWAVEYVDRVISNRIMTLDESNNFRATEYATRAEVCDALARFVLEETVINDGNTTNGNDYDSDNEELTQEELDETIDRVIYELSTDVIKNLQTDDQKEIINDIIFNMNAYKSDNTHDYEKAAELTYEKYKKLSEEERETLKYEVQIRNSTVDLINLQEFFFPDVEI